MSNATTTRQRVVEEVDIVGIDIPSFKVVRSEEHPPEAPPEYIDDFLEDTEETFPETKPYFILFRILYNLGEVIYKTYSKFKTWRRG